jgi:hypothetical protein
MNNLIEDRVNPIKLLEIRNGINHHYKNQFSKRIRSIVTSLIVLALLVSLSTIVYYNRSEKAEAIGFGLGNNYEEVIALNQSLAGNVPLSLTNISTSNMAGDKRVVALLIFLEKYKSPMAQPSVARTFVESADKYGFGDKWYLLPAISGIESAFGRLIPYYRNISSYNAWGWSGGSKYGRWSYFASWEDAVDQVSRGIAEGYSDTNFDPEKMMARYCPPCALPENNRIWARTVKLYMNEQIEIYKSL